jgi:hypothetical protein
MTLPYKPCTVLARAFCRAISAAALPAASAAVQMLESSPPAAGSKHIGSISSLRGSTSSCGEARKHCCLRQLLGSCAGRSFLRQPTTAVSGSAANAADVYVMFSGIHLKPWAQMSSPDLTATHIWQRMHVLNVRNACVLLLSACSCPQACWTASLQPAPTSQCC